ncbi:hypothetical protein FA15DRAFT_296123 [Coprinopsis marcescibilis]|uniref:Uncharacterized protein n=1 Tax=Coprinopsis marcescibilis TaxID=230819 RepID=A0A5C3KE51_COPMA|nr:hypothetical protein FA15DRAFT_296123 [Coprinopsis marcescibilis]
MLRRVDVWVTLGDIVQQIRGTGQPVIGLQEVGTSNTTPVQLAVLTAYCLPFRPHIVPRRTKSNNSFPALSPDVQMNTIHLPGSTRFRIRFRSACCRPSSPSLRALSVIAAQRAYHPHR